MNQPATASEERAELFFRDGVLHQQAGRLNDALLAYKETLASNPRHVYALANSASVLRRQGKLLDALQFLVKAARLEPNNPGIHNNLGNALSDAGAVKEAISCFRKALRGHPEDATLHCNYGRALLKSGEAETAIGQFEEAIRLRPDYTEPRLCMGIYYHDRRDYAAAEACFRDILRRHGGHGPALFNLATLLRRTRRYPEALLLYERLLAMQPNNAKIQYWVDALRHNTPKRAPAEYIAGVFNEYAIGYEAHLAALDYQLPQQLRALYERQPLPNTPLAILDLGCGTGLAGEAFADMAETLVGVDLATQMLKQAKQKAIYTSLHAADMEAYLARSDAYYALILAADVLIYSGDLTPFLTGAVHHLEKGGSVLFSTERGEQEYRLNPDGRYSHADAYVNAAAKAAGLTLLAQASTVLRRYESSGPVQGTLWNFRR